MHQTKVSPDSSPATPTATMWSGLTLTLSLFITGCGRPADTDRKNPAGPALPGHVDKTGAPGAAGPSPSLEVIPPFRIVGNDLSAERRAQMTKTYEDACREVTKGNASVANALKDRVNVIVVGDVKAQWRQLADEMGFDPRPPSDLSAFTLGLRGKQDGKIRYVCIFDREVFASAARATETVNHEFRHVEDPNDRGTKGGGAAINDRREAYAYGKTVEDLQLIKERWRAEGRIPDVLRELDDRIAVQQKHLARYRE